MFSIILTQFYLMKRGIFLLRKELELHEHDRIESILQECKVCRIAMIANDRPYIIPMVFGYGWDNSGLTLYLHCGLRGTKNQALKECPYVCFEMDIEGGLIGTGGPAHTHSRSFSAIVGEGEVVFAKNSAEKRRGFDILMRHQTGREGWTYPDAYLATAEVFWIRVDSLHASHKALAEVPGTGSAELSAISNEFDESHGMYNS